MLLFFTTKYIISLVDSQFCNKRNFFEALDSFTTFFITRIGTYQREYNSSVEFHGHIIKHRHYVDFFVKDKVYIECKAVESLGSEQRQQLWNTMRLSKVRIGILYNFAPTRDQCEHYYLDTDTDVMYCF